jgi:hypothetical protein
MKSRSRRKTSVASKVWRSDDQTPDNELVQMGVGPAESGLNDFMELREVETPQQQQTPPDRRLDALDGDLDLVEKFIWIVHAPLPWPYRTKQRE